MLVGLTVTSTKAAVQVYTVYDGTTKTMTYYCDDNYSSLPNNVVKEIYDPEGSNFAYTRTLTEHIVVDASMKNYNLTTTKKLFSGAGGFTVLKDITGLENLNTSKVTNMNYMFYGCETLESLWFSLDLSKVQTMDHMFENCKALTFMDITHHNYITASELTSMVAMFQGCEKLEHFRCWDLIAHKLEDVSYMFSGCEALETAEFQYSELPGVKYAKYMFKDCSKLTSKSCIESIVGDKTVDISYLFAGCKALKEMTLDPKNHLLTALKNAEALFLGCEALEKVSLPCIGTATKLSNMNSMFMNCDALTTINCDANLSTLLATSNNMFEQCRQLIGNNGTKYTSAFVDKAYARPDRGAAQPGYFTSDMGPLCATPTNPSIQTYGTTSVTMKWTKGASNQNKWEIVYQKDGGTEQTVVANTNPYKITGLTAATKYYAKVRAVCSTDNKSDFSSVIVFETTPEIQPVCDAPKNFEVQYVTKNSADFSFTPGSFDQTKWFMSVTDGADFNLETTLTMPSYFFTNLTPNTTYSILAHAICSDTEVSNDVSFQFTTLPQGQVCETPTNLVVDDITTNSAQVSFTPGSEEQTQWRYLLASADDGFDEMINTTSFKLKNLKPNTEYWLILLAVCADEYQSQMVECKFTTKQQSQGPSYVCDFTKKATAHETFNDAFPWGYDNDKWGIYGGANRNGTWPYMELGGNSDDLTTTNPVYIINWQTFDKDLTAIRVNYASGSLADPAMSLKEWGVNILDQYGSVLYNVKGNKEAVLSKKCACILEPEEGKPWTAGCYFVVYWDVANTSNRAGVIHVLNVEYYTDGIPQTLDNFTYNNPVPATKIIRNGQLLIIRNGQIYNAQGARVE